MFEAYLLTDENLPKVLKKLNNGHEREFLRDLTGYLSYEQYNYYIVLKYDTPDPVFVRVVSGEELLSNPAFRTTTIFTRMS